MDAIPLGEIDVTASIVILLFSLVCVAFFTSSEAVLMSVNKIRIHHLAEQGLATARAVERIVGQEERFFATVILGQNLFIILASSVGTALSIVFLKQEGVMVATIIMTVLVVLLGEMTPKILAVQVVERYALLVAYPLEWVMKLLAPITYVFSLFPTTISRLLWGKRPLRSPLVTEGELRMLIDIGQAEGTVAETERKMLHNVFEFGDRRAREVMVPRPDIVWVEKGTTLKNFLTLYRQFPHARFPVYHESIDNVVGTLSIRDVLIAQANEQIKSPDPIDELVRAAYFVPETKRVGELFGEMQTGDITICMVVDEFGGIAGLVTREQLVAEIVGRLGDELVRAPKPFEAIDERTFQIDGGMSVEEANETLLLGIPLGNYETLAGFVLEALGHIPRVGEQLTYEGLKLVVTEMQGVKIERLLVQRR